MDVVPQTEFTVSGGWDTGGVEETHHTLGAAGAANMFLERHPELAVGDVLTIQGLDQPWKHEFTVCRLRPGDDLLVTYESKVVARGVGGGTIRLSHDEIYQVRHGARSFHKYDRDGYMRCISLDDYLTSRILGRKTRNRNQVFTVYYDGHIQSGKDQVWATGGREVIEWALAHTTEYALALRDYIDHYMWVSHSVSTLITHNRFCPDHAPGGAWRHGEKLPADQYRALLEQIGHDGYLAHLEVRLSELAREAGYG